MSWRDRFYPASFRGVGFYIDTGARAGGRRGVNFEYPKRDTPTDEDMGRRAKHWAVTGYVLGPDYDLDAQDLEDALNAEGPGLLVHPNMGEMQVRCETYTRSDSKDRQNVAMFDMTFVEAGTAAADLVVDPTQFLLRNQSDAAAQTLGQQSNAKAEKIGN
jgi:prophage DNA circulation protein